MLAGGGHAALGHCSALVRLLDCQGHVLCAAPGNLLKFVPPPQTGNGRLAGSCSSTWGCGGSGMWVLAAAAHGRYTLQDVASGHFLTVVAGELRCSSAPDTLQLFMDLDRRVMLRLPGKTCLQASPSGAAVAGRLPLGLGQDRAYKLFRLEEAGLPAHSMQAWPLRAALRCEQTGGSYLSASGSAVSPAAPVACCSEEFLLSLGESAPLSVQGSTLVAADSSLWTGDGRRLLSHDTGTGQVLLQEQHGSSGREQFTLRLTGGGELSLLAQQAQQQQRSSPPPPPTTPSAADAAGSSSSSSSSSGGDAEEAGSMPVPVTLRHGALVVTSSGGGSSSSSSGASKPAKFLLELASNKPVLLQTAHGQLLGCQPAASSNRPAGILLPTPSGGGDTTSGVDSGAVAAAAGRCAWLLLHHGDSVYSLRHGGTQRSLYIDDLGAPCLDEPRGHVVYPDQRLLFWIEPAWVTLLAPGSSGTGGGGGSSSTAHGGADGGDASSDGADLTAPTGSIDGPAEKPAAAGAACPAAGEGGMACFLQPLADDGGSSGGGSGSGSLTVAGFIMRSLRRVGGRHLYLSVLPDGLVTTVYATSRPSRWELFTVIDYQTLVQSPLRLLDGLPAIVNLPAQQQLRRAASMQALSSSGSSGSGCRPAPAGKHGARCGLPRAPSMPAVQEHQEHSMLVRTPSSHLRYDALDQQPQQQQQAGQLRRRCHSDTALADLQQLPHSPRDRQPRPQWLAQLLSQPRQQQEGWGSCSAASLQDLACRQLCVTLVQHYRREWGGGRLAPGVLEALEAEISVHLPEEVAARIRRELRLLTQPPAPTKLSLQQLSKRAAAAAAAAAALAAADAGTGSTGAEGGGSKGGGGGSEVPAWAAPFVQARQPSGPLGGWDPVEGYLCCCCRGASNVLLPLDPYCNPGHHLYLEAMERVARGGGRVRLRARRRHDQDDFLVVALKTSKLMLFTWAASRCLGALLFGSGGSAASAVGGSGGSGRITARGSSHMGGASVRISVRH